MRIHRSIFIAASALLAAACSGGGTPAADNQGAAANDTEAMATPGNDASALEAAAQAPEANAPGAPPLETGTADNRSAPANESAPVSGISQGGDTGGNTTGNRL